MELLSEFCPECRPVYSQYHHIHKVDELPRKRRNITHGYAAGMHGPTVPQTWVFFEDLEPALVFGKAGRMSGLDITGYGVYEAAREVHGGHTLHIKLANGTSLDRQADEPEMFRRWLQGVDHRSAYFQPQSRR